MNDLAAVVFDMDGLLLDTENIYRAGFRTALQHFGLPADDALYHETIGLRDDAAKSLLRERLGDFDQYDELAACWEAGIAARLARDIPVKPGVTTLIDELRRQAIPYIIATSTLTDRARRHLDQAGIGEFFQDIVGGEQVNAGKPAPDIYLEAVRRLGQLPAHCVAFEDSENGVRAAIAAGLVTVQVPDLAPPSAACQALGHRIAPDLLTAAQELGLRPAR